MPPKTTCEEDVTLPYIYTLREGRRLAGAPADSAKSQVVPRVEYGETEDKMSTKQEQILIIEPPQELTFVGE